MSGQVEVHNTAGDIVPRTPADGRITGETKTTDMSGRATSLGVVLELSGQVSVEDARRQRELVGIPLHHRNVVVRLQKCGSMAERLIAVDC